MDHAVANHIIVAESIRVRGRVQGVGFRPTVWRLAQTHGLCGHVLNDGDGVLIEVQGSAADIERFVFALHADCPPLARIERLQRQQIPPDPQRQDFQIRASDHSAAHTGIVPDAATCADCLDDIRDPTNRRHGYAFTNCTHCGPRLSIIRQIPYDRAHTSMAAFTLCPACQQEYDDPSDRRFHAQPNACPVCGPQLWLESSAGEKIDADDAIVTAAALLRDGQIVAIKGIGGFHLACDAGNEAAVQRLRQRKQRPQKPLALMARDLAMVERYCTLSALEAEALQSSAAPIVILERGTAGEIAASVAPGQRSLGFMLPYSPLHHLLLAQLQNPIVLTSGNRSDEPQCIDNADARNRLGDIADFLLLHNRDIVNRIDDSVLRQSGEQMTVLRRARGLAPASLPLPAGFENAPDLLALGGELKNTFCLLHDAQVILSQHMGDLEDARTFEDFLHNLGLYGALFQHQPKAVAVDCHPEYLSSKHGRELAQSEALPLLEIQHHHAHIAACLAEKGHALDAGKVLGIALDGLGFAADGGFWGGEFLLADYHACQRLGHLRAFAMPGAARAMQQPWRNTYAQLASCFSTDFQFNALQTEFAQLAIMQFLLKQPLATFDAMLAQGRNAPLASSCGRWFDAVAAALGVCTEGVYYEAQAAIELEALVDHSDPHTGYEFALDDQIIDPTPMWRELLGDLRDAVPAAAIAARFHRGLGRAIATLAIRLCQQHGLRRVALSGGVMQNKFLLQLLRQSLAAAGLEVLEHRQVPANDGGIALGQAVIAAATLLRRV